jgi:hypothetical protein
VKRGIVTICAWVAMVTGGAAVERHVESGPRPTLTYSVIDRVGVPADELLEAHDELEELFGRLQVGLIRVYPFPGTERARDSFPAPPSGSAFLPIYIVSEGVFRASIADQRVLGFATRSGTSVGPAAFVAYNRTAEIAASRHLSVASVLAHVIAHELGHLLLSDGHHTYRGLMRAHWSQDELLAAAQGHFGFTRREADAIRKRVRALAASRRSSARPDGDRHE